MGGGFRLRVRWEKDEKGAFASPLDARGKVINQTLRAEAQALLQQLKKRSPRYAPLPLEKGTYEDRGLRNKWKLGNVENLSATGAAINIMNTAAAPGLERVSLFGLLTETGAQPHRIPKEGDTLLAFPMRGRARNFAHFRFLTRGWKRQMRAYYAKYRKGIDGPPFLEGPRGVFRRNPDHRSWPGKRPKFPHETGYMQFARHVNHPGFHRLDFARQILAEENPERAIRARLQRSGAGQAILSLLEQGSFERAAPSFFDSEEINERMSEWNRIEGGLV